MPQIIVTGAQATGRAGPKRRAVRVTATNSAGASTATKTTYVLLVDPARSYSVRLTATNSTGSSQSRQNGYINIDPVGDGLKVTATGVRAAATATAQAGTVGQQRIVAGVRAAATATAQVGTIPVFSSPTIVTGSRAAAYVGSAVGWGKHWGAGWGGTVGHVLISQPTGAVVGVRAAATATAQAGQVSVAATGVRAAATAAGQAISQGQTVSGVRATATAQQPAAAGTFGDGLFGDGTFGNPRISGHVIVTATGVRSTATATAQPGTNGSVTVTGVRATATATGQSGTVNLDSFPAVILSGSQATATATGRTDEITITVGAQAPATAAANAGTPTSTPSGEVAPSTATGLEGSPVIVVTGEQAVARATTESKVQMVAGARAISYATGQSGSLVYDGRLFGAQALATATARPGRVPEGYPPITRNTKAMTGRRRTLVRMGDGRTKTARTG